MRETLEQHFDLDERVRSAYRNRNRDPHALDEAVAACEAQIELAPRAAEAFRRQFPQEDELPYHRGFSQLAIILEKRGEYDRAISLCELARSQGWSDDWDKRIERCRARKEGRPRQRARRTESSQSQQVGSAFLSSTYVAFDVETTGLDPASDTIIEIAGVKFDLQGNRVATFQRLAKPRTSIPKIVERITGITDEMVRDAGSDWEAIQEFADWVGPEATLIAHNAPFDCKFFWAAYGRNQTPLPPRWAFVDTLQWARAKIPSAKHDLPSVLRHLRAAPSGHHRALADAEGVVQVTVHLANQLKNPLNAVSRRARTMAELVNVPATARQLDYLRDLGAPEHLLHAITRDRASQLIDHYKNASAAVRQQSRSGCALMWMVGVLPALLGSILVLILA